jgi:hypothetical protein
MDTAARPASTTQNTSAVSAPRQIGDWLGMKGTMSILRGSLGIGAAPQMREVLPADNDWKDQRMPEDNTQHVRQLELRIKSLEARIAALEDWTGIEGAGDQPGDTASVVETLLAQEKVIRHLLRFIDFVEPKLSLARFKKSLAMVDERGADPLTRDWPPEFAENLEGVIARLIPGPLPRLEGDPMRPETRP